MQSFKGRLLIAAPSLTDPNFVRTVVLIVHHDADGALGLVLNREASLKLRSVWGQVSESPCERDDTLHHGGPCDGPLMVLHAQPDAGQVDVCEGVAFSGDPEKVEWLVRHGGEPIRFFAGYAGWSAGQLESECDENAWFVTDASASLVFEHGDDLWRVLMRHYMEQTGIRSPNPDILPVDPNMN